MEVIDGSATSWMTVVTLASDRAREAEVTAWRVRRLIAEARDQAAGSSSAPPVEDAVGGDEDGEQGTTGEVGVDLPVVGVGEAVGKPDCRPETVSALRVCDVAVWMSHRALGHMCP
ncbi:hypothetical protein ACIGXF_36370 [Streptomyces sp. NPDC053086]|uniref:hypothetical protein n=1 Tax=unclassified Streptomyces TaxID=2593676 RepID=UPI0037D3FF74